MSETSTSPPEGERSKNSAAEENAADKRPVTSRGESRARGSRHSGPRSSSSRTARTNSGRSQQHPVEVDTHLRLWLPHDDNLIARGYNNSDRNVSRRSLGSATDRVAEQRRVFGPWLKPDPERQQRMVARLAPHKRAAPPDPKFIAWVNHFEYYQNIGIDFPKTRKSSAHQRSRDGSVDGSGANHSNGLNLRNTTQYHRLLKRPRTTAGYSNSGSDNNMSDGNNAEQVTEARQSHSASSTSTGRSSKAGSVVSGLDRRYMGLQAVSGDQLRHIVSRLTKMTSAYDAKFAPNPHVWIDTSPGAHMVRGGAPPLA